MPIRNGLNDDDDSDEDASRSEGRLQTWKMGVLCGEDIPRLTAGNIRTCNTWNQYECKNRQK